MTALVIPFLLVPLVLILPAFVWSRKKPEKESLLLPFVHMPAIALWWLLVSVGFGAQSLSNIVELLYLGIAAVVLPYLKVFLLDRFTARHTLTTYGTVALLAGSAFFLRAWMPVLPE